LFVDLTVLFAVTQGAGLKPCQTHFYCVESLISKVLHTKQGGTRFASEVSQVAGIGRYDPENIF